MAAMISLEANKSTIRQWGEQVWNRGNLAMTPTLITEDFVCHRVGSLDDIHGREGHDRWVAEVRARHPDFHVEILDLIAEGDRVASSWWGSGPGMHIYRMDNGRIAEMWTVMPPAGS